MLQRRAAASQSTPKGKPVFPFDFFEHVQNVTADVTLAGQDVLTHYTSDVAKQRLRSAEEYLVSPNSDSFRIVVQNTNPDMLLAGVRVCLGHSSTQHIAKEIRVFDRVIETHEGTRRWYDIPFTREEMASADREFTLTLTGGTYVRGNAPVLDSMEVYAVPKDDAAAGADRGDGAAAKWTPARAACCSGPAAAEGACAAERSRSACCSR